MKRALSEPRWCAHNQLGTDDVSRLACYMWGAAVHSALQPAIHVLEVTLRNTIYERSLGILDGTRPLRYNALETWLDATPSLLLDKHRIEVEDAKRRILARKRPLSIGALIAELNFGFWTGLFDSNYEHGRSSGPRLWPKLAVSAFPYLERSQRTRRWLSGEFHDLRNLRNRIAHHEPVWTGKAGVFGSYERICTAIGWMNHSAALALRFATSSPVELLDAAGPEWYLETAELLVGDERWLPDDRARIPH